MDEGIYRDRANKEYIDYEELKKLHRDVIQRVFESFKKQAFGEDNKVFEEKIMKEIDSKY